MLLLNRCGRTRSWGIGHAVTCHQTWVTGDCVLFRVLPSRATALGDGRMSPGSLSPPVSPPLRFLDSSAAVSETAATPEKSPLPASAPPVSVTPPLRFPASSSPRFPGESLQGGSAPVQVTATARPRLPVTFPHAQSPTRQNASSARHRRSAPSPDRAPPHGPPLLSKQPPHPRSLAVVSSHS